MKKIIKFFTVLFFRVLNRKTEIIVSSDCLVMKSRVLTNFKGGGKIIIEKGCSLLL